MGYVIQVLKLSGPCWVKNSPYPGYTFSRGDAAVFPSKVVADFIAEVSFPGCPVAVVAA